MRATDEISEPTETPVPPSSTPRHVAVIGAGAAGSMAAIFAATAGAQTTLIERTKDGGRKILISGGGRCNVLPASVDETRFITDSSPNTLRKIVRSWPLAEQIKFFETELGIPLEEEIESVKLFPASQRARDVRDGLLALATRRGVKLQMNTLVTGLFPLPNNRWRLTLDQSSAIEADAVIVATGGLSVPNTGSDGTGLRIMAQLGHTMHPTYAALTPLVASPPPFGVLSGISLPVTITARSNERSATASGGFLFTHHGYSGPSVLNVSHVVSRATGRGPKASVQVCWTPLDDAGWERALAPSGNRTVLGALRAELPDRLADMLVRRANVDPTRSLAELRKAERLALIDMLVRGELPCTGDDGYKKAEVTGGGVSLAEINPKTMESRKQPNLFLCGEVLDAFGPIGGYNFFWAWATGRAAGMAAGQPIAQL